MDTQHDTATRMRHPRLASLLIWLGLVGAFGGGGADLVHSEIAGNGIDWGTLNACLTFGILLSAFGECWSHTPTSLPAHASHSAPPAADRGRSLTRKG